MWGISLTPYKYSFIKIKNKYVWHSQKTFTACDVWQEIYTNTNLCAQASEYLLRDEKGRFYDGEGEVNNCYYLEFIAKKKTFFKYFFYN